MECKALKEQKLSCSYCTSSVIVTAGTIMMFPKSGEQGQTNILSLMNERI